MLRLLALPVAVAAVLATAGCAMGDRGDESAPSSPDASTTQPAAPSADATAPVATASAGVEPSAAPGTDAPSASASDASGSPSAVSGDPGVPGLPQQSGASIDDVLRLGAVASWIDQPRRIALSLPASGSCWAFAAEPVVESPTRMVVRVEQPQPCGDLDAARTYSIEVPEGIDTGADLRLAVVGLEHEFTLTLPAG